MAFEFKNVALNRILVPLDGSQAAIDAAERAAFIAKLNNATVTLLCVVDLNNEISAFEQVSMGGYVPAEIKEKAYKLLLEVAREIPGDIKVETKAEIGTPAERIVEIAEVENYDLVVMGSRGLGAIKGLLMGSVSQYVLQHAHCPVLIVR